MTNTELVRQLRTASIQCDEMRLRDFGYLMKQAADVAPVRSGHWQITDAYPHNVYCSECHKRFAQTHWAVWEDGSLPRDYCPNCGAKMDCYKNV